MAFKKGDYVTDKYRSGTGHGKITGVEKQGKTVAKTEYDIEEFDHHPGEPDIVHHYGSDLKHWYGYPGWIKRHRKGEKK